MLACIPEVYLAWYAGYRAMKEQYRRDVYLYIYIKIYRERERNTTKMITVLNKRQYIIKKCSTL